MTHFIRLFIIISLPISLLFSQGRSSIKTHNFSGSLQLSVNGIFTLGKSDYSNSSLGFGTTGLLEYFVPTSAKTIFGMRMFFGGQTIGGSDKFKEIPDFSTDMYILGGGLSLGYTFDDEFFPYLYGGVSNLWFSPKDKNGKRLPNNSANAYSRSTISYDLEVGSRIILQDKLSLFFGAGMHFVQTDNIDDITLGDKNDSYYSGMIGISYTLFGKTDSDGDGIPDDDDPCPSNAEDYDGFQDEDGCPDYDNDGDKIPDELDKCPNEPEDYDGFQDKDGCPDLDNDGDGIPDSVDNCPNQPENFNGFQDKDGCPDILDNTKTQIDSDNDGIPDYLDLCPNQPENFNGLEDEDGCPDSVVSGDTVAVKEIILEGKKLFDYRGSEIISSGYEELDKTADFLMKDAFIKWSVESYTDNDGDPDSLKTLSYERARTLVKYFIDKGLPSFMFRIYGKGSESPIESNKTIEGRISNNRIVINRSE
jgi:outer membrane protein OmpA-like peptidoglycan-associated protein